MTTRAHKTGGETGQPEGTAMDSMRTIAEATHTPVISPADTLAEAQALGQNPCLDDIHHSAAGAGLIATRHLPALAGPDGTTP